MVLTPTMSRILLLIKRMSRNFLATYNLSREDMVEKTPQNHHSIETGEKYMYYRLLIKPIFLKNHLGFLHEEMVGV